MRTWAAAALAMALACAACGSTVSQERRGAGAQSAVRGGESDLSSGGANADTATGATGAGSSTAASSRAGAEGSTSSSGGGAGAVSTSASGIVVRGPGSDNKNINVGVAEAVNSSAANAALGAGGISQGDLRGETNVVVADINAHGGVAGRQLNLIWHTYDNTSTASADRQEQEACDDYTHDHKVFVVMGGSGERDLFRKCINDAGAMEVSNPLTTSDQSVFERFKYYVEIGAFRIDRMAAAWPDVLKRQGFFGGWNTVTGTDAPTPAKVGIVTYDYPTFTNSVNGVLVPKLKAMGYTVDPNDVRAVTWLQSNSDLGATAAGISSAVLRFRQDGVTHVFIVDERGLLTLLFVQQAQSQRYFPRYGWNSQNGPQALKDGANFPSQQLIGSKGMGWAPGLDIPAAQDTPTGPYSNASRKRCNDLYKSKGVTFADHNAEAGALDICTSFWFLRDVMNTLKTVSRDTFMRAVDSLGSKFEGAGAFGLFFGPKQHDGVTEVRTFGYDAGCDCMQYTSGPIDVG